MSKKLPGYWTKKRCHEVALKCRLRGEFHKKHSSAYDAAYRNGWLDEICSHMKQIRIRWSERKCQDAANECKSRDEFYSKYPGAYKFAINNNILDKVTSHLTYLIKPANFWNFKKCTTAALSCKTRKEFSKKYPGAYSVCLKNNWIDELCAHMKPQGNRSKKFLYAFEFDDNSVYVGLTYNIKKRLIEHTSTKKTAVKKHLEKTKANYNFVLLTNNPINVNEAIILEGKLISKYKREGWNILNIAKAGAVGKSVNKWTFENVKNEALKYNTKSEFSKNSRGAFNAAYRNGWLELVCSHMKKNSLWTKELCKREALKYKTIGEFLKKSPGAFQCAYRNGWLDEICPHMKRHKTK
jgi:predicted GIY-YIG superfamily endonuclease